MGENPSNVYLVGAPGLDDLLNEPKISKDALEKELGVKLKQNIIVVLQHPLSTSPKTSQAEIKETLAAVSKFEGTKIIIYPNGDVGSDLIIAEINKYKGKKDFVIFKNIQRNIYANILRIADVFVGNSSGGIIETASFGLPTVNIGIRQFGRERNNNIFDVDHDKEKITKILNRIFKNKIRYTGKNLYGDGKSAKKIVTVLENIDLGFDVIQKHFYEKN